MELKDKNVLVTGGGSGIGLGIALALAQEGGRVAITGRDPEKLQAFYGKVFDWTFKHEMEDYTFIATGQDPGGGLMKKPPEAPMPAMYVYFLVDDVSATLKKVEEAGGKMIVPKTPIPNMGAFGMFADPEGIVVGIFEPLKK